LDTTFGTNGSVTHNLGGTAYGLTIQYDGKIIIGGGNGYGDFALARYNADGTLDTTFDGDGKVTTDFGSSFDHALGVLLQGDGKILAVGQSYTNGEIWAIARYNANGALDSSFGGGGKVTTDFGGVATGAVLEWDGKLVVAGYHYGPHSGSTYNYDFALARYWLTSCP
jgi:uncharacterized delta-60 repeat protein